MSNYKSSTQLKYWNFGSEEEILKIRDGKMRRTYGMLKKSVDEWNNQENQKMKNGGTPNYIMFQDNKIGRLGILNVGDEVRYINAIIFNVMKICEHMKFNDDVLNTSIEYLKRFYLKQSVYNFDAIEMMYAVVYLAVKVEETNFSLPDFARVNKGCEIEKLLQHEIFLIKGLKFQFFVYSPYRCFDGFYNILLKNVNLISIEGFEEKLENIKETGRKALRQLHYTDCSLLYSPSLIAFSALVYSFQNIIGSNFMTHDEIIEIFRKENLFNFSFWAKGPLNTEQEKVSKICEFIEKVIAKDPNPTTVSTYK